MSGETLFPALTHFLDHEPKLGALEHLPDVLMWIRLLLRRYNRHIDREKARATTIKQILSEVPASDQPVWEAAFGGFEAAWNAAWQHVKMFQCREIPEMFRDLTMSVDCTVSFCLPCEQDEGICPLALVQHLATEHNALVFSVDERMLMSSRQEHHAQTRSRLVSSRHLTAAHTVRYDLEDEIIPFFEKQCMTQSGYDFGKAEARLIDHHLLRVPAIDLEMRVFTYSHEQHLRGGLAPLKAKIVQEALPPEMQEAIARELGSPTRASAILEMLETVVSFITATGGSFVATLDTSVRDLQLAMYIKTVLLMDEGVELGRVITTNVQLKHLESLWNVLTDMCVIDPMAGVSPKYKQELSPDDAAALNAYLGKLAENEKNDLVGVMKSYVTLRTTRSPSAAQFTTPLVTPLPH